jgi:hypothetical protein
MKCEDCNQEMQTAITCNLTRVKSSIGKIYFRIPYGAEYIGWADGENLERFRKLQEIDKITKTCHDCGVSWGGIHHNGCDFEICPHCLGQFISCDCAEEGMELIP